MKLSKYLILKAPFSTKESVDELLKYLHERNMFIDEFMAIRLKKYCIEDLETYLQYKIDEYMKNYRVIPGKPKKKGLKVNKRHTSPLGYYKMLKTDDIHPPKSVISVHFFCLTCLMALQI